MHKALTAILFGLSLTLGAGIGSAQSGEATFKFTNNAPNKIMVKLFSQNRNWTWPAPDRHYNLDDDAEHSFKISCQDGEKICYGGSETPDDAYHWGVGLKGDQRCQNCCIVCGNAHKWNLTKQGGGQQGDHQGQRID
jgi:hypothetical protein